MESGQEKNEPIRRSLAHCRVEDRPESQGRAFFSCLDFDGEFSLLLVSLWMESGWGLEKKKLISPSFRHTMCGGGGQG